MCWKDDKMLPIVVALAINNIGPLQCSAVKFLAQVIFVRIGAELGQINTSL